MKAKIRKTGEIVIIAEYAKIALEQCDSYGNTIELRPEEIELIQEPTENDHWQDVRERAAIGAIQGMISSGQWGDFSMDEIAKVAVGQADSLIRELKSK